MRSIVDEAIVFATGLHQGQVRKFGNTPYILHPLEVAQIISTMTDDQEVIASGILHDIVEETTGTLSDIEGRFGKRVGAIVASETEQKCPDEDPRQSWRRRKEESLRMLRDGTDVGVKILWLADKLANMRSLSRVHQTEGDAMWGQLHQSDPAQHLWYYRTVAKIVEPQLKDTAAFKEYVGLIDTVWPHAVNDEPDGMPEG